MKYFKKILMSSLNCVFCSDISVSNPLSTLSSTLLLSVSQPLSHRLMISIFHGPLGVPSCIPFLPADSSAVTMEAVYLGDPVTLLADVGDGVAVAFSWCFTHEEKGKNMEGVKTICMPSCLHSTVVSRSEKVVQMS